jgi:hypothetical protein
MSDHDAETKADGAESASTVGLESFKAWWNAPRQLYKSPDAWAESIWQAATLMEREACAVECERMEMYQGGRQESAAHNTVWDAAKAIRKRSNANVTGLAPAQEIDK